MMAVGPEQHDDATTVVKSAAHSSKRDDASIKQDIFLLSCTQDQ